MSKPNPRSTRSRFSSPFVPGPPTKAVSHQPNGQEPEKHKTFLDKWIEPALPAPRPSFAEAGLERQGVVTNMAPLGTRPAAKALKIALRLEGEGTGRGTGKSRGGTPAVATPKETAITPDPSVSSRRGSLRRVEEAEAITEEVAMDDLETLQPVNSTELTSASDQSQGEETDRSRRPALQPSPVPDPSPQSRTPVRPEPLTSIPSTPIRPEGYTMSATDRIVEFAVQDAVTENRWATAFALRTLYDGAVNLKDRPLLELFEAVSHQSADDGQQREFMSLVRARKIAGKKDRAAEYYFLGDSSDSVTAQPQPKPQPQPQISPAQKRPIIQRVTRSSRQSSIINMAQPSHEHVNKKQRGNSYKPSTLQVNSNDTSEATTQEEPATPSKDGDASPQDLSPSSTSSPLSSVDEKVLSNGFADSPTMKTRPTLSEDTQRRLQSITSAITGTLPPPFVSPYANAQSFAATAETLGGFAVRNQSGPIAQAADTTPKTHHPFSTSPAPELSRSSSSETLPVTTDENHDSSSFLSHNHHMAPIAITIEEQLPSDGLRDAVTPDHLALSSSGPGQMDDLLARMKRKARLTTEKGVLVEESFVRGGPFPDSQGMAPTYDGGDPFVAPAASRPNKMRPFNRDAKQKYNYDSEDLSSPTLLDFRPGLAPGSMATSRAGTPASSPRPTRKVKTGSGLRVKTSPMKKKGALAGLPRPSGERTSPVANGTSNNQDENDDYCAACGGNGALVCCDTCPRSFHFKCVDPPIDEDSLPDEEWYCNLCATARNPHKKVDLKGTFGHLLSNLDRKNPSAFHLPQEVRDYFVDVKTGIEGEYEDVVAPKPKKSGSGYDEPPDYFKMKDSKGNTILCHQCHGMAVNPNRAIISCTYCPLSWHLDCVPVPLANPPVKAWRCPAHVDDLLIDLPGSLRPAHRFRRVKGAAPIEPALSRGIRNNGYIEIQNDLNGPEQEQGFYDYTEYGKIYKLPELGIKLDFITKVRETTGGGFANQVNRKLARGHTSGEIDARSIADRHAALNLMSLGLRDPAIATQTLYDTLLAEAPRAVVDMIAQGDPDNIQSGKCTDRDKHSLLALRALIDAKLSESANIDAPPSVRAEDGNDLEMAD